MSEFENSNIEQNETTDFLNSLTEPDHYQLLNVSPKASRIEIRDAYLRMKNSIMYNNAAFYSIEESASAEKMLADLEKAFFVLENEHEREKYDRRRIGEPTSDGTPAHLTSSSGDLDPFAGFIAVEDPATPQLEKRALAKAIEKSPIRADIDHSAAPQIYEFLRTEHTGDSLRRARELVGLSLDAIFEVIRIPANILDALENEDYDSLPSTVYVRGFLVNYLRFLNFSEPKVFVAPYVERYEAWMKQ